MSGPTMLAYATNLYENPYGLNNRVVLSHNQLYIHIYFFFHKRESVATGSVLIG